MQIFTNNEFYYPLNYSKKMNGKLTYKVKIKDDYIRTDGTSSIYVQVFIKGKKKIFPMDLSVPVNQFDKKKQRVSAKFELANDYNLIIEKFLSKLNQVEINYRLSDLILDAEKLSNEINNPTSWIDFIKFWEEELERQSDTLRASTYRQQLSSLNKLKRYKSSILFHEIDNTFLEELIKWLKTKEKNTQNTISSFIKNFKKYLHKAEIRGIRTVLKYNDIKSPKFTSNRTFLMPEEIRKINTYYISEFINETHKAVLSRFLFSCFTGLRISDIQNITQDNIVGDFLVFSAQKTTKLQRIPLNETAKGFINKKGSVFENNYTPEYINRVLKDVIKICGIKKNVTFHVARHTFATNFLISGGRVEVLQKVLGHSKIDETMIYVHIADSVTNEQIFNMDNIIKN